MARSLRQVYEGRFYTLDNPRRLEWNFHQFGYNNQEFQMMLNLVNVVTKMNLPETARVGWLGMGPAVGPHLLALRFKDIEVFEIEPVVVKFVRQYRPEMLENINLIEGDFRQNLTGEYDLFVYEVESAETLNGDETEKALLQRHLAHGGKVLVWPDWEEAEM